MRSDIFHLQTNLLKYLLRTFLSSAKFQEVFALCVFTLWLFPDCSPFFASGSKGASNPTGSPKGPDLSGVIRRIDSHDSRESESRVIRANRPDAL